MFPGGGGWGGGWVYFLQLYVDLDGNHKNFKNNQNEKPRAANNGRSTDNDRGLDRSNSGLAGHFDRSFLDTNTLFSIQLSLNAL